MSLGPEGSLWGVCGLLHLSTPRQLFPQYKPRDILSTEEFHEICYLTSLSPGCSGLESPDLYSYSPSPLPELGGEWVCRRHGRRRERGFFSGTLLANVPGSPSPGISLSLQPAIVICSSCSLPFFFFLVGCFYSFMLVPLNYSFLKEINSSEPAMEKSRVCFRHAGIFFDPKFWFV